MDEFLLVLAGGLVGLVTAVVTNRSADNRLKIQHAHESKQREKEQAAAIRREPAEHLKALISVVTTSLVPLSSNKSSEARSEVTRQVVAALYGARVAMMAIDEKDVVYAIDQLTKPLGPLAGGIEDSDDWVEENAPIIRDELAVIESHRTRLLLLVNKNDS